MNSGMKAWLFTYLSTFNTEESEPLLWTVLEDLSQDLEGKKKFAIKSMWLSRVSPRDLKNDGVDSDVFSSLSPMYIAFK
jgi:hypothetical protein